MFLIFAFHLAFALKLAAQNIDSEKIELSSILRPIALSTDDSGRVIGLLHSGVLHERKLYIVKDYFSNGSCNVFHSIQSPDTSPWFFIPLEPPVIKEFGNRLYLYYKGFAHQFFIIDKYAGLLQGRNIEIGMLDIYDNSSGYFLNFVSRNDFPSSFGIIKYNTDLDSFLIRKHFAFSFAGSEEFLVDKAMMSMDDSTGNYYVSGTMSDGVEANAFVMKLDSLFNTKGFKVYNGLEIKTATLTGNHLYVGGIISNSLSKDGFLAKIATDELSLEWGKMIQGEQMDFEDCVVNSDGDNIHFMGIAKGKGSFSALTFNAQGELEWEGGYGQRCDVYTVNQKGEFFGSRLQEDTVSGTFSNVSVKLESGYGGTECGAMPFCAIIEDYLPDNNSAVTLDTFPLYVPPFGANEGFELDSGSFDCSAYCPSDPFIAPSPAFSVPEKFCQFDTMYVQGNANALAHGTAWHLTGPGVDSTLIDSLAFRYVFTQPGTYTLEQTIWYLGCAYSEAHEVEVLPPLELSILPEGPACSPPLQLGLQASRPLQQIQWAHGPTEADITVQNQGWYTVTASDGICTATDSLEVTFVDSLLAGAPALSLHADTTVCLQDLPFSLDVQAPLADSLLLDGILTAAPLPLPQAGTYLISACIQGCCYPESFKLETYDCAPRIYMPTAISPNGDGINDELFPQGKNFTTLSLKVFHRWGGLVHSTEGPAARWDAHDAPTGTYVWLLEYRSHYDGSTQRMSGEVEVVR